MRTLLLFTIIGSSFILATSPLVLGVSVNPTIVSPALGGADPASVIADIYQFALAVSGLLAFSTIVYGGIKYTISAGSPSGQSDAKEWITSALWGLLLLTGAALIFTTLNPRAFPSVNNGGGVNLQLCPAGQTNPHYTQTGSNCRAENSCGVNDPGCP